MILRRSIKFNLSFFRNRFQRDAIHELQEGIDEVMRGIGKDATIQKSEKINGTNQSLIDNLILRTHRSFVEGTRLDQLSKHPAKMRGR